jgi:hypothetical protein
MRAAPGGMGDDDVHEALCTTVGLAFVRGFLQVEEPPLVAKLPKSN